MKQIIIIPSYNSNKSLKILLSKIREIDIDTPILVVDDGSPRAVTSKINGVNVIRNECNMGKGVSLINGFRYAFVNNYTHALTMDSDLQHLPEEISSFLECDESVDFVIGCRDKDASMPLHRKISNAVTSLIISLICGAQIIDSQCGYRRYRLSSIVNKVYKEAGFSFESEILIKCVNKSTQIKQPKISTVYDVDNKSYINNVSDTVKFIKLILRTVFL